MNIVTQILVKANNAMLKNDFDLMVDARADLDKLCIDEAEYNVLVNHIEQLMLILIIFSR